MKSIIQTERECFICKTKRDLHRHHIYFGTANRVLSEKYGCWCYLCAFHHNMSDYAVHFNKELDIELKRLCQAKWEAANGSRNEFIATFGKSYL